VQVDQDDVQQHHKAQQRRPNGKMQCTPDGPLKMPAFALAHAAVDVSLSTSVSSALSGSASQHVQQQASADLPQQLVDTNQHQNAQMEPDNLPEESGAQLVGQEAPVIQILSQLDNVKWDQVAAWAAGDSAQAAALVDQLGPHKAESMVSEPDRDTVLLRLEAQVARKKLVSLPASLLSLDRTDLAKHCMLQVLLAVS